MHREGFVIRATKKRSSDQIKSIHSMQCKKSRDDLIIFK